MYVLFNTHIPALAEDQTKAVTDIYGPFDSEEMAEFFRDEFFDDSESPYIIELTCPYSVYWEANHTRT